MTNQDTSADIRDQTKPMCEVIPETNQLHLIKEVNGLNQKRGEVLSSTGLFGFNTHTHARTRKEDYYCYYYYCYDYY